MNRAISNSCFVLAISGCMLLKAAGVPNQTLYLVFFSVAMSAILTNLFWIRTIGLIGIGGLSLAHSSLAGQNPAGAVVTVVIGGLVLAAVVLMIFAGSSNHSKSKRSTDEV